MAKDKIFLFRSKHSTTDRADGASALPYTARCTAKNNIPPLGRMLYAFCQAGVLYFVKQFFRGSQTGVGAVKIF